MDPKWNLYLGLFCRQYSRVSHQGSVRTKRGTWGPAVTASKQSRGLVIVQWGKSGHPGFNVLSVMFMKQPQEGLWVLVSSSLSWNRPRSPSQNLSGSVLIKLKSSREQRWAKVKAIQLNAPPWSSTLWNLHSPQGVRQTLCWLLGLDQLIQELHTHQDDQKRKTAKESEDAQLKGIYGLSSSSPFLYRGRNKTSKGSEILFPRIHG